MHELSYVQELFTQVKAYSTSHKVKKVTRVRIAVSKLSGIESDSFKFYWNVLIQDTAWAATKLSIRTIAGSIVCMSCNNTFFSGESEQLIHCPACGSIKTVVNEGTSVVIKTIEIET